MIKFISDSNHYYDVIELAIKAKNNIWIGTADIKDMIVLPGKKGKPFLGVLSELIGKGVNVRLIHAKEPGQAFREDFDKYKHLSAGLERVLCPRVHFKIIVIDCKTAYIGSANLTGAG
ncbi:MAG: phospholipase, partial [Prevotellaceae bacterium]|nr:phospholipase [Candidatus Faecinaster equi]